MIVARVLLRRCALCADPYSPDGYGWLECDWPFVDRMERMFCTSASMFPVLKKA